ncbi:MAG: hypothetical protein BGO38_13355 [Cellulomonas sp. 73-145]|uniref:hypothetical protein n=1 Tax=unclassified Cellulomonas TaxID=2620175 RepID=UPI00092C7798|nr:hypothetical protein [Cellulomonas sp. 73-145]OJV59758.1 MAG: hypothetical protein BGO38_13355 [Cellulomonas sp. 73-145]
MRLVRTAGWWALGTFLIALALLPVARVPILGDDLHAYFETYALAHGSAWRALTFGWGQGMKAGHFNPVGQAIGALYHFGAFAFSSSTGMSPQRYHVAGGAVLLWLTVLAAAAVLVWGVRHAAASRVVERLTLPRAFALVAGVVAVSLELHPWTNDPVSTFAMAGWGSAAIGFLVLGLALRATVPGRAGWVDVLLVAVVGSIAVLYYEELTGMVAGAAAVYLLVGVRARRRGDRTGVRRVVVLALAGVVLPAVVFVLGRYLAIPSDVSNYTGTAVAFGPRGLATWWAAMVGALPGGGLPFLLSNAGGAALTLTSLALGLAMVVGLGVLAVAWRSATPLPEPAGWSWLPLVVGICVGWALTTATQAFTPKYIEEIQIPGQVYLYYSVGVVSAALLISWVVVAHARGLARLAPALLIVVGAFAMVQVPLNWQLGGISASAYTVNHQLSRVASDDNVPSAARCAAVLAFAERPWPDYYRKAVVTNAITDFQLAFGTPLCPDPEVDAKVDALVK